MEKAQNYIGGWGRHGWGFDIPYTGRGDSMHTLLMWGTIGGRKKTYTGSGDIAHTLLMRETIWVGTEIGIGIGNVYYNCAVNNINGWVQICML